MTFTNEDISAMEINDYNNEQWTELEATRSEQAAIEIEDALREHASKAAHDYKHLYEAEMRVADIEARIKAEQERVAAEMRNQHEDLYIAVDIARSNFEASQDVLEGMMKDLWIAAGKPSKKAYFGSDGRYAIKVQEGVKVEILDENEAIKFCRSAGHNHLLSTKLDTRKFKQALKDEFIDPVKMPVTIATREVLVTASVQRPILLKLAEQI